MGCIYCLFSSADGLPRYIGQTRQEPSYRWKQHIACALDKAEAGALNDWIRNVLRSEDFVHFYVLQDDVTPKDLNMFESYWMQQFPDLLNRQSTPSTDASEVGAQIIAALQKELGRGKKTK